MNMYQKIKFSISSDLTWLNGNQCSLSKKIRYIFEKYFALLIRNNNRIFYLKNDFFYDNKNAPVTLQAYPPEINLLHQWVDFTSPKKVLDIGANIGQFSVTLASMYPKTEVFTFEANPSIYSSLTKNTVNLDNIHNHNIAIGPAGSMDFYYVPGYSGKGSFIEDNSSINLGETNKPEKINVELVELNDDSCSTLGIPSYFDLVKIDVEGFEYEVLNSIRNINTDYLFIEFSMSRAHHYTFHTLLNRIHESFGDVEILYCDYIDLLQKNRTIGNLLVKCGNVKTSHE